jgi:hypothetical protein
MLGYFPDLPSNRLTSGMKILGKIFVCTPRRSFFVPPRRFAPRPDQTWFRNQFQTAHIFKFQPVFAPQSVTFSKSDRLSDQSRRLFQILDDFGAKVGRFFKFHLGFQQKLPEKTQKQQK